MTHCIRRALVKKAPAGTGAPGMPRAKKRPTHPVEMALAAYTPATAQPAAWSNAGSNAPVNASAVSNAPVNASAGSNALVNASAGPQAQTKQTILSAAAWYALPGGPPPSTHAGF